MLLSIEEPGRSPLTRAERSERSPARPRVTSAGRAVKTSEPTPTGLPARARSEGIVGRKARGRGDSNKKTNGIQRGGAPPAPRPAPPRPLTLTPCSTRTRSRSSRPKETLLPPGRLPLPPMPPGRPPGHRSPRLRPERQHSLSAACQHARLPLVDGFWTANSAARCWRRGAVQAGGCSLPAVQARWECFPLILRGAMCTIKPLFPRISARHSQGVVLGRQSKQQRIVR